MKFIERFIYILIVVVSLVYTFTKAPQVDIKTISGDSIPYVVFIDKPIPYDTTIYNTDTLWLHDTLNISTVDTVYIYDDFFKLYEYNVDTNINEVDISILSKITQNRLYQQNIKAKNNRQTKVVIDHSNQIMIGGIVGRNMFAPTASYQFKKHQIGLGFNVMNNGVFLQYQYKIK